MTERPPPRRAGGSHGGGKQILVAGVLIAQSLAAVFFIADVVADFTFDGFDFHSGVEAVVALALGAGVLFGALEMRRVLERARTSETALMAASGAFASMIDAQFDAWELTPAERDVAMLALKGFDGAEIADLRGAAAGTVRAQLARVYAKAGVSNRAQLVAVFIEDLLGGPIGGVKSAGLDSVQS